MPKHKNRLEPASNGRNAAKSDVGQEGAGDAPETMVGRPIQMVREYPASASLTSFVFGCCAGAVAAMAFAASRRERRWYEASLPYWADQRRLMQSASRLPAAMRSCFSHR